MPTFDTRVTIVNADNTKVVDIVAGAGRAAAEAKVAIDGRLGNLRLGGNSADGDLLMHDESNERRVHINSGSGPRIATSVRVYIDGAQGNIRLGGDGADGDLVLRDGSDKSLIHLDAGAGGSGSAVADARVYVDGRNGNIRLGGNGSDGDLDVLASTGNRTIHLDGDRGDIVLSNADAAEEFDVSPDAEPGMVMRLSGTGILVPASTPYDRRVIGIVAGAGRYRPALVLDRQDRSDAHRLPVSVLGKASCFADATYGPIQMGDLLTTSATPGAAMTATSHEHSRGSIIGKAMTSLHSGRGMVDVLVGLG